MLTLRPDLKPGSYSRSTRTHLPPPPPPTPSPLPLPPPPPPSTNICALQQIYVPGIYSASCLTVSHLGYHKISLSKTETLSANQHLYSLKEVHIIVPLLTSNVSSPQSGIVFQQLTSPANLVARLLSTLVMPVASILI